MDSKKEVETKSVDMMVGGELLGTKLVVPSSVNFNENSRRVNIHLNKTDIISISSENLQSWANVNLDFQPGGKKEEAKEVQPNSAVEMRYTGNKEEKRFFVPTKVRFDRNRDTLEVHLPENHRIDVGQSRFKSMGLKLSPDLMSRTVER